MSPHRQAAIAVLALVAASCSTATSPKTGELTVTVTGLSGLTPSVTVNGPNGYQKTITATQRLSALAPGSYTITAANVLGTDSIVPLAYAATITGTPATVSAGANASATVTYAARGGTGALWMVGGGPGPGVHNAAMAYTPAQLRASGTVAPSVMLNFPVTAGYNIDPNDVAFDAHGNLWIVDDNENTLVEYPLASLVASGSPAPAVTIQLPPGYNDGFTFDTSGNVWIANEDSSTIIELTAGQLTASGQPTPAITIIVPGNPPYSTAGFPLAVRFDAHGNLWVLSASLGGAMEYTPDQLKSSGSPTPVVSIASAANPFPYGMAFDKSGNLWLADAMIYSNGTPVPGRITEVAAGNLTTSGSPPAAVTLTLPTAKYVFPSSIAFDDSGDLWYADVGSATINEFTAAQLSAGGNPSPVVTIANPGGIGGTALAFNPHPAALPLH